ncbi:MAG: PAS domain S-box protein [Pseudomonadota bacterium]
MSNEPTYEELKKRVVAIERAEVEREKALKLLHESEERFRTLFMSMSEGFYLSEIIYDDDGNPCDYRYLEVNPKFEQIMGLSREQIIGKRYKELVPADTTQWMNTYCNVASTGIPQKYYFYSPEYRMHFDTIAYKSAANHITVLVIDITERRQAEQLLYESEARFKALHNASFGGIAIHEKGIILECNQGLSEMTGYSLTELIGMDGLLLIAEKSRSVVLNNILSGHEKPYEVIGLRKNGEEFPIRIEARNIPYKGRSVRTTEFRDITESRRAEEEKTKLENQLQQAQKFEAIGTLAGGVAHDFNNLLMGIQGRTSLLSLGVADSHPNQEHIQAIEEYIRSASNLTKQLLGLAHGGKYEVTPIDINELVLGSSAMFGRTKKEIKIHTKCQELPLVVEADRGQIEQVLLNMYINAWQAMPPGGGDLYIETNIINLDEAFCEPYQTDPGRYIKVSITDTGSGMDEATRQRIFDPFFTTKDKSRGTGMGLASAYGIIKNHGGMITVYSELGHGATFNIYLPESDKEAHRKRLPTEGGLIKGKATILLVDDEELISFVGKAMLENLGYRVIVSMNGQEAIDAIKNMGSEIDLVILDMIMPGMDGSMTFDRLQEIKPGMLVLLSSGYSINGQADKIMRRGCNDFIQKPYSISELSIKVNNLLSDAKRSAL